METEVLGVKPASIKITNIKNKNGNKRNEWFERSDKIVKVSKKLPAQFLERSDKTIQGKPSYPRCGCFVLCTTFDFMSRKSTYIRF